jgi:tRNA(Ile2) C34 agmatinyltransferase TiaS
MHLNDPYVVTYEGIYAICDPQNRFVEIIENSRCFGGSAWTMHHYASSPLIIDVRSVGNMIRYRTRVGTSELALEASVAAAGIESVIVTGDLAHNIASELDREDARYLSHSLIQLFPAPSKTQNCVSTVLEFGCMNSRAKQSLLQDIKAALEQYSVSSETGMVVIDGFDASHLEANDVQVWMDGNGIIGALAALPWFDRPNESVKIDRTHL